MEGYRARKDEGIEILEWFLLGFWFIRKGRVIINTTLWAVL
jgi:hypothetical protein